MLILRIFISLLSMFCVISAFAFYYRERPKVPVYGFSLLGTAVFLMWLASRLG